MKIVFEIDGVRHELVEASTSPCDHCSLEDLCNKGNFEVGMCVDLFDGSGKSRFVKEEQK